MFQTQTLEYRQLSVLLSMFGSSFKSNFGGKNVAHVCFLKCLEGRWFPEFYFFFRGIFIQIKSIYKNIAK